MNTIVAHDHVKYERLRYVTQNFQSLQGLTLVCLGGMNILFKADNIPGVALPRWLEVCLTLLGFGLAFAAVRYMPSYYERRFGSVESRVRRLNRKEAILILVEGIFFLVFVIMLFLWPVVSRYANPVVAEVSDVAHRMVSDPDHRANLAPPLLLSLMLFTGALGRPRGLRLQRWILCCACFLLWTVILVSLPLRHPEATQQTLWRVLNACWFWLSIMLWGLYNHLMLVHFLPARGQINENE
jgi:hypothetical protein